MKYIIIWAILQAGAVHYANPDYHHTFATETTLEEKVGRIKQEAFRVDIEIYEAKKVEFELDFIQSEKKVSIQVPHLILKGDKE